MDQFIKKITFKCIILKMDLRQEICKNIQNVINSRNRNKQRNSVQTITTLPKYIRE